MAVLSLYPLPRVPEGEIENSWTLGLKAVLYKKTRPRALEGLGLGRSRKRRKDFKTNIQNY